jgi:hypothetical protein
MEQFFKEVVRWNLDDPYGTHEEKILHNSNLFLKYYLLCSLLHFVSYSADLVCNKARTRHQLGSNGACNWQLPNVYNL